MKEYLLNLIINFIMFGFSFYCLSGLDFGKICLPGKARASKAQLLLVLSAMALGYLSSQFIFSIMYRL